MKTIIHKGERFYADVLWDEACKRYYCTITYNGKVVSRTKGCMTRGGAILAARKEVKSLVDGGDDEN